MACVGRKQHFQSPHQGPELRHRLLTLEPLARALLNDGRALVRGHAAWALGRLGGELARGALARARQRECEPWVREEIDVALESGRGLTPTAETS